MLWEHIKEREADLACKRNVQFYHLLIMHIYMSRGTCYALGTHTVPPHTTGRPRVICSLTCWSRTFRVGQPLTLRVQLSRPHTGARDPPACGHGDPSDLRQVGSGPALQAQTSPDLLLTAARLLIQAQGAGQTHP